MIKGWARTIRDQKAFTFLEINDGSTLSNFQVIMNAELPGYKEILANLSTGASVMAKGMIVESPGQKSNNRNACNRS